MTNTAVAGNIQKTFNAHLYFGTKCTFYFQFVGDDIPDGIEFIIIPLGNFLIETDVCLGKDILRRGRSDSEDIGQASFPSLVFWTVYTGL